MKSLRNKKGFTIVELVIVIAVIAILAAVLIPTFSNIVENAKKSSAMQKAKNAYTDWLAADTENVQKLSDVKLCIESDGYYFHVDDGQFETEADKGHGDSESGYTKCTIGDDGKLDVSEESSESSDATTDGGTK